MDLEKKSDVIALGAISVAGHWDFARRVSDG